MEEKNFSFKGKANEVTEFWHFGYRDAIEDQKNWFSKSFNMKFGPLDYSAGYAEGNITSRGNWYRYWESTLTGRNN